MRLGRLLVAAAPPTLLALAAAAQAAPPIGEIQGSYPEGPVVIDGALYVAEMGAHRVRRFEETAEGGLRQDVFFQREGCGPTALAALDAARIVVLCHLEGALAVVDRAGALQALITETEAGQRIDSPNDVSADGRGGAYFSNAGRFDPVAEAEGRVMRLAPDLTVATLAEGLAYANGVAVDDARGRVLVSEHMAGRVLAFPMEEEGRLGAAQTVLSRERIAALIPLPSPVIGPDGIEIAPDGAVLVALYASGRYLRLSPEGDLAAHGAGTPFLCNLTFWRGRLVLAGAFDNRNWPLPGLIEITAPDWLVDEGAGR